MGLVQTVLVACLLTLIAWSAIYLLGTDAPCAASPAAGASTCDSTDYLWVGTAFAFPFVVFGLGRLRQLRH